VEMMTEKVPHKCGDILDINWVSKTRVNYNCKVCGQLIAWSDTEPIKKEKIYPKPEESQYNPLNVEEWK
jgi:hypothetical protein